jgi:hypothetical protein
MKSATAPLGASGPGYSNADGRRLSPTLRRFFEPHFGRGLADVRLHDDAEAHRSARDHHARAYTLEKDIVFGEHQFRPDTREGLHLIAHELAHVVQSDRRPSARKIMRTLAVQAGDVAADSSGYALKSDDPQVDGRDVFEVGGELLSEAWAYRDSVSARREYVERLYAAELRWAQKVQAELLRPTSWFLAGIEALNSQTPPDPSRWQQMHGYWDEVIQKLDASLSVEVTPDSIGALGGSVEAALQQYADNLEIADHLGNEFLLYMEGFQRAAKSAVAATSLARDITFAGAVAVAVVVAAPVVATGAGALAVGVGFSGTTATVVATGGTVFALGTLGGSIEGAAQGSGALILEGVDVFEDLVADSKSWEEALYGIDFGSVAFQSWDGFKRGFIDGVLAYAGLGMEKFLVGKASALSTRLLGANAARIPIVRILESALNHAVAGGFSGAVTGALDAGLKAALAGKTRDEIVTEMEVGFFSGAAFGTVLGTAGGVFEGRKPIGAREGDTGLQRELYQQYDEAQGIVREMWTLMGGVGEPPRVRFEPTLDSAGQSRAPDQWGALGPIVLRANADGTPALTGEALREVIAHEAWHTRIRQIFPDMYEYGQLHRNFIALDETLAYGVGKVLSRGRPQTWAQIRAGLRDLWNSPASAAASLDFADPGLKGAAARRLWVIDKGRFVLVGVFGVGAVAAGSLVLDCYELAKDVLGEPWQQALDAALDEAQGSSQ